MVSIYFSSSFSNYYFFLYIGYERNKRKMYIASCQGCPLQYFFVLNEALLIPIHSLCLFDQKIGSFIQKQ